MPPLSSARARLARAAFRWTGRCSLLLAWSFAAVVCCSAGCTSVFGGVPKDVPGDIVAILEKPESFSIFALNPYAFRPSDEQKPRPPAFHNHAILGQAEIADARPRERIVALVYKGIRTNDGAVASCFNPRHGVRATRDGRTVDLSICFECLQVEIYAPDGTMKNLLTSDGVAADMNKAFEAAGLHIEP